MNNGMRILAVACLLMNVLCFGMDASKKMVKLQVSKNDRKGKVELNNDIIFHAVPPRANKSTQLSLRATCHYGKNNIEIDKTKIEELEKYRGYLANPETFRSVWENGGGLRPNSSARDFNNLKTIFRLTDIEAKSQREAEYLRSSMVYAISSWDQTRHDWNHSQDYNHGQRTGIYGLLILCDEENTKFAKQLEEKAFRNRRRDNEWRERDEYCVIS